MVAVPVSTVGLIDFDPELPRPVADAITSVPMGTAAKLAVATREAPGLRAIQDVAAPYWCWTGRGADGAVRSALTAFCGSAAARERLATSSGDGSVWRGRLVEANPDLTIVGAPRLCDWGRDPLTLGCYSAFDNRAADRAHRLRVAVGRVVFAGEHTEARSAAMDAALLSGRRAAEQLAGLLD